MKNWEAVERSAALQKTLGTAESPVVVRRELVNLRDLNRPKTGSYLWESGLFSTAPKACLQRSKATLSRDSWHGLHLQPATRQGGSHGAGCAPGTPS